MIQCAAPGLTPWFYSVTADVGDALEGMNFRALEVADETLLNVQALAYVKTSIPRSPSQGRRRRRGACLDAGAPTGRPEGAYYRRAVVAAPRPGVLILTRLVRCQTFTVCSGRHAGSFQKPSRASAADPRRKTVRSSNGRATI